MAGFSVVLTDSFDKLVNHSFIRPIRAAAAMACDSSMTHDNNKSTDSTVTTVVAILTALS